jgi:hypothetical protein
VTYTPHPGDPYVETPRTTVADLSVRDFGSHVAVNGYQGDLVGVAIADDPFYVEVKLDGVTTWAKPDMPVRIGETP